MTKEEAIAKVLTVKVYTGGGSGETRDEVSAYKLAKLLLLIKPDISTDEILSLM